MKSNAAVKKDRAEVSNDKLTDIGGNAKSRSAMNTSAPGGPQQNPNPKNNVSESHTVTIISIIVVGLIIAWYTGSSSSFASPPSSTGILLERPPHKIPAATWHHDAKTSNPNVTGPLTSEQVRAYMDDGFLILPRFFEEFLAPLQSDVEGLIDELANELHASGHVHSTYANESWTKRLLRLTQDYPDAPLVLIKGGILPINFQRLFANPRMLDIASQLGVGPDVAVSAAWNLRAKMKKHEETTVPWHQDNSYWEPRIWDEHVVTVWVALVDANIDNGCLQLIKGGHKSGKTARHTIGTTTRTWYTELSIENMEQDLLPVGEDAANRIVTAQVPAGTAILFPGTTPHRSLNSASDAIRWSADYRLHRVSASRPGKALDEVTHTHTHTLTHAHARTHSLTHSLTHSNGLKGFAFIDSNPNAMH